MSRTVHDTARPQKVGQASSTIEGYALEGILPQGYTLTLKDYQVTRASAAAHCGILTLRAASPTYEVLDNSIFTYMEMLVLRPLLKNFPHYAPYEHLYCSFLEEKITLEEARHTLGDALHGPTFDFYMRPIRNIMSRVRLKLHAFDIDVLSIIGTGYVLSQRKSSRREDAFRKMREQVQA